MCLGSRSTGMLNELVVGSVVGVEEFTMVEEYEVSITAVQCIGLARERELHNIEYSEARNDFSWFGELKTLVRTQAKASPRPSLKLWIR